MSPVDDMGAWPVDDEDAEILLAGGRTDRDELVSLESFLHELRAPGFRPQPSEALAKLFAGGPAVSGSAVGESPVGANGVGGPGGSGPSSPAPRTGTSGRKPVRKLAKVAAATTTAALAVTLAAAAQVLPTGKPRTPISVSSPATPVRVGAEQRIGTGTSEVQATVGAGVTVQRPPSAPTVVPPSPSRPAGGTDFNALSPEALARLPIDILRTLPGDVLARVPAEVLKTLPAEALSRLPIDVLKALPGDALARLPTDVVKTLPGDALARLPLDVLRTLPGDALARLPLELLQALPLEVQLRLPAEVFRLLFVSPTATTPTTAAPGTRP